MSAAEVAEIDHQRWLIKLFFVGSNASSRNPENGTGPREVKTVRTYKYISP